MAQKHVCGMYKKHDSLFAICMLLMREHKTSSFASIHMYYAMENEGKPWLWQHIHVVFLNTASHPLALCIRNSHTP